MKTVVGNDLHSPFHDIDAVRLFCEFIHREKPDRIVLLGDIHDFYTISRFDKNPNWATPEKFKSNLRTTRALLRSIRNECSTAEMDYVRGNHEMRMQKYLWKHGSPLADLDELKVPHLLYLASMGITYHEQGLWIGDLYLTHGSIIRKHAGYTAKAEFEKNGCTGMSAHTHRDGKYTVRLNKPDGPQQFAWWENYCLCDLNPEYLEGIANWSQGFSCITTIGKRPYVEQIPIIDGSYIYGGQIHRL